MRRTVYSSAVFSGYRPLCTQILRGQGRPPSTILGIRKLETLGYPTVKTAIPLRSLIFTQYRSVTDRRTDGFSVAYTVFANLCVPKKACTHKLAVYCVLQKINVGQLCCGPKWPYLSVTLTGLLCSNVPLRTYTLTPNVTVVLPSYYCLLLLLIFNLFSSAVNE